MIGFKYLGKNRKEKAQDTENATDNKQSSSSTPETSSTPASPSSLKISPARAEKPKSIRSLFRRSSVASSLAESVTPSVVSPPVFKTNPQSSESPAQSIKDNSSTTSVVLPPAITDTTTTRPSKSRLGPTTGSDLPEISEISQKPQLETTKPRITPLRLTRNIAEPPLSPSMFSPVSSSGRFDNMNGPTRPFSPLMSPKIALRPQGRLASFSSSRPTSGNFSGIRSGNKLPSGAGGYEIRFVQESAILLKKRSLAELGAGAYQGISDVSYVKFLEWIRSERLTALPHKGSRWDKVLIRALYFAEHLHNFDQAIEGFAVDSSAAAAIGYGHAQLLLELGSHNSDALDKAFSVFYKFSRSFHSVLHRSELLAATPEIQEQLCLLYTDLLSLVTDVAIKFYKTVNGMTSDTTSLDIYKLFGTTIDTFNTRQSRVVELIWGSQIERAGFEDGEALDVKVLSSWLDPQDRVLASLNRDHSTFVDQMADFTCLWFQKKLSRFIQSNENFLLITGQPGAGKTTLAGSIVERLQRPVNRKQYDTLFCSLSPDIPTTATSLAVAKSLLFQLLTQRVGNMGMYYALFRAYNECRIANDIKAYEEHLWQALAETLQEPIKNSNELIIVVDGLDEIAESQSASIQATGVISPAVLLEKLINVTNQGSGVRLITLSSSIKTPSSKGSHHQIIREDLRDDIHAVASKTLSFNNHFQDQRAYDQEALLDRIIQASNGSFLWAILACETLNTQKSPEALNKALEGLESSKPSVQDLVLKVFTSLNTNSHAKTLLSWILAAERPLTIDEIHTLFTIDTQRGTLSDTGISVGEILKTLKPLLIVHERIVRFKHPIVHSTLLHLADQNKISIPLKESETDLLLRVLTYAKVTLRDESEPRWVDSPDIAFAERLFHQHPFLEYTVRYWVLHLQQSPLAPKPNEDYKPTAGLQKALPSTTLLPILEQLTWNSELPTPQAVELHKVVGTVRRAVFTVDHPSVLQTYLALATSYLLLSITNEAQSYFYYCIQIARKVLSDIHPLTLECATHFLKITETMTTNSRTEIMTHREEVLIILITAYERHYGSTSDLVINTRKLLAELYASVNEEDRAVEIYRLIQEAVIQQYGRGSVQSRDIQGQLDVTLGKRKGEHTIDNTIKIGWEVEEEDDQFQQITLATIHLYLSQAESYVSRKEFALADKAYVELWMEVSSTCRNVQSIEWHEKNIDIAIKYCQFLKAQNRASEAAAILTCIWQQYSQHQVSFAETIVSRLINIAKELKDIGYYTQALSVFKFASSYFKNVRKEESPLSREIAKEVSETSTKLVKQSLESSKTTTETTTTVSESVFQEVFFSIIQSSKAVDANTIALAKKLSGQYIEKKSYPEAISIIHATLQRIWPSFLSNSIHDVVMPSTFIQESIELVERLAEIYMLTRQLEKVEDTYSRFFRATLVTKNVDKAIFEKAKTLLVGFYDKHGYADKAISIYQEILVTYRARLGHDHQLTIQTLYTLARRCQRHPRNHPYWIDYYLQIITSLNKDSDVCHKDALDAIILVTNTYSEDRRYAEAVTIYRVLWNTFVRKPKEHVVFGDAKFVSTLYERYYQCLEETKASYDALYNVASEYYKTVVSTFGPESTIALEAALVLAQVAQLSEDHLSQAISLYETVSKSPKTTTTTKTTVTDIKQSLSSLYMRQMNSTSSSTVKAESIQRALAMAQERFTETTSKYGYPHESALTRLMELVVLYHRQQKSDAAVKQLTIAVSEIISKEPSSQKLIDSAATIAACFHACEQTSVAHSLVQELHRQICGKESRYATKWSFDLTKCNRSALAFLASFQYHLREDKTMTFAEIMADLTMEYIYFEQFRQTLQHNESLTNILLAAAPLRWFLRRNDQKEMIRVVEDQAVELFVMRDAQDLNTLSKESPRIFLIGILDYLGNGRNKDFNRSVILASNDSVAKLTTAKKFFEAYDVANLGFLFASKHGYNGPRAIGLGFKLASLLVGRHGEKTSDPALRKKTLELSNRIVKRILDICKRLEVNFAQIQLFELSNLSALLGEQEDYETLEWLLRTLWNTRDAQRSWPTEVLLNLGRRLICARYLAGLPVKAIRLAEDIAYNMRRAHGPRAPVTIETYELLAQLYTSTGQSYQAKAASDPKTASLAQDFFKKALGVHEDILRVVVRDEDDDSDDEDKISAYLLAKEGANGPNGGKQIKALDADSIDRAAIALRHLHLMKLSYQRLGGWPKPYDEYSRLNAQLFRAFGNEPSWKGVQGTEKWDAKPFGSGKAESQDGGFMGISDWSFGSDNLILHAQKRSSQNGLALTT